jgi:hypothetical protein
MTLRQRLGPLVLASKASESVIRASEAAVAFS